MDIRFFKKAIIVAMMAFYFSLAGAQELPYSLSLFGSITTTSKLYFNPDDPDPDIRNQSYSLDGVWGLGLDVRRTISRQSLSVGISGEYLRITSKTSAQDTHGQTVSVSHGYRVVPIELTGYFTLPISSETISIFIGGGAGVYIGERHYLYADVPSKVLERKPGIGIHVVSGVEYSLCSRWSVRAEVKFREVQFESTNAFPKSAYDTGISLPYSGEPFTSRIIIDGTQIVTGLVVHF